MLLTSAVEDPNFRDIPYQSTIAPLGSADLARLREVASAARVLVVGSLNIDQILDIDGSPQDDSTLLVRSELIVPGGHAGNCAAALANLGAAVDIAAAVGADPNGDRLVQDLSERGITTDHIRRCGQASTGRVVIPLFRDRHFMLMSRGANELLTAEDVEAALCLSPDAVVLFDPTAAALVAVAQGIGRLKTRPRLFWTPGGIYSGSALVDRVAPACDTLFLNHHEHALVAGRGTRWLDGAAAPESVVTLGALGSLLRSPGAVTKVAAPEVGVVDPTGAGDAFSAAYILASLAGLEPAQRLAFGNAAGAIAVTAAGARGRLGSLDELFQSVGSIGLTAGHGFQRDSIIP